MPQTKEEKAEYQKQYRINNKEEKKEYMKQYRIDNKEKIRQKQREYNIKNKESILENQREYFKTFDNKNHHKNLKKYQSSEKGIKNIKIQSWKSQGLIGNYDEIYDRYINCNNCEECNIELTCGGYNKTNTRVMDHDHYTGLFRNILCCKCNNRRG